ncbi:BRISC and BRCA1-A complex member 1-like [Harmonia axyridis]|uniref:BRISC and BRCA1-A complex member 1-like n=1 Tax=Harmonia axyridis TaxID=115357 RepID=UPI001E279A29|nr:BRISC and BRCA1-A complex member 1-like [Harmonia axyridis]
MASAENEARMITLNPDNHLLMTFFSFLNHLPSYNVKEKIIIAIDTAVEYDQTNFHIDGHIMSPLFALASAAKMFITLKKETNPNHEFFILPLKGTKAVLFDDFNNNCDILDELMKDDYFSYRAGDKFDLDDLFVNIATTNEFWNLGCKTPNEMPPPFILRLVFLYNRSHTIPKIDKTVGVIQKLIDSPHFFMDVLVTHNPVSHENNCEKIFKVLQNIDSKGFSYFFNIGRDYNDLTKSILKLIGHPLQRPLQSSFYHSL